MSEKDKKMSQSYGAENSIDVASLSAGSAASTAALPAREHGLSEDQELTTVNSDLLHELPGVVFAAGKRVFDIGASLAGLLGFGILLPLLAVIIKLLRRSATIRLSATIRSCWKRDRFNILRLLERSSTGRFNSSNIVQDVFAG